MMIKLANLTNHNENMIMRLFIKLHNKNKNPENLHWAFEVFKNLGFFKPKSTARLVSRLLCNCRSDQMPCITVAMVTPSLHATNCHKAGCSLHDISTSQCMFVSENRSLVPDPTHSSSTCQQLINFQTASVYKAHTHTHTRFMALCPGLPG